MANIAQLAVQLTANTTGFFAGMRAAQTPVQQLANSVTGAAAKLKLLAGAAITAATAGGIAVLLKRQSEEIDALGKMSDRLGLTTENLIGFQHAAKLAGVEQDALNGALQRMIKNVSDAAQGSKGMKDVLAELGIFDARRFAAMEASEQFIVLVDRLNKVQHAGDRVRLTLDLFGKTGGALIPIIQSGSDSLLEMMRDAERLGLTISRMDAAKVEAMNDAWTRLQQVFSGIARQILPELAPLIQATIEQFIEWASVAGRVRNITVDAMEWIARAIAKVADAWNLVKMGALAFQVVALNTFASVIETIDKMQIAMKKAVNWLPGVDFGERSLFGNTIQGLRDAAAEIGAEFRKLLEQDSSEDAVIQRFREIRAAADEAAKVVAEAAQTGAVETSELADELDRARTALDAMKTGGKQFRAGTLAINSAIARAQADLIQRTGGSRGTTTITSPQLQTLIGVSQQIAANTKDRRAVAVAG